MVHVTFHHGNKIDSVIKMGIKKKKNTKYRLKAWRVLCAPPPFLLSLVALQQTSTLKKCIELSTGNNSTTQIEVAAKTVEE